MEGVLVDQSAMNRRAGARGIVFRSCCPKSSASHKGSRPQRRYSSLPYSPPPLLRLPISTSGIAIKPQRKPRSGCSPRKEQRSRRENAPGIAANRMPIETPDEEEEMVFDGSLYSISPPPSSLPLPRFSTAKPKLEAEAMAPPPSCVVEAMGSGGGIDAGATDDLRRLLRL
ncbi:hypothetical protein J5N97_029325 [Dioscorea zingiberensis]|uniref:Uncharacterized protein n=1 Tax=Dioscorea zingiberensis TaxID=325984 RepID=A0A9D5H5Q5_9LILI|nr:hypothetical protein J5N97_029325 [Dioscorea zingiberensis]